MFVAAEMTVICGCLAAALPAALAVYPPTIALPVASLEADIQQRARQGARQGQGDVLVLYANKGL
jgi:hypothetical protein